MDFRAQAHQKGGDCLRGEILLKHLFSFEVLTLHGRSPAFPVDVHGSDAFQSDMNRLIHRGSGLGEYTDHPERTVIMFEERRLAGAVRDDD